MPTQEQVSRDAMRQCLVQEQECRGTGSMRHLTNFGDRRSDSMCVHCGRRPDTRDHMPSRVFLDDPLPANLPVSPACLECNNEFSADEEYLAVLIECVVAGDVLPVGTMRPKIARTIMKSPKLVERIRKNRKSDASGIHFDVEFERVQRVFMKLARGHAAFEYNELQLGEPTFVAIKPLHLMTFDERNAFEEAGDTVGVWPEVGSRAMQRLVVSDGAVTNEGWIEVQHDRYRYQVSQENGLTVRLVIRECIAAEVTWG